MAKPRIETGIALEARVQRLFMCQGAFAERGLFVRAARGDAKLVTDIDVISHDYNINFHHRRIYAECKGGQKVATLDRVIWVRGLKEMLSSEFAYLVLDHCDPISTQFARSQNVEILTADGLESLETALSISKDFWPGRSNLAHYEAVDASVRSLVQLEASEHFARWLSRAQDIWREASQLLFSYGRLNALVSVLQGARQFAPPYQLSVRELEALQYATSAMLVRLSQYVMFAASDTLSMTSSERAGYLAERLAAGNLDLEQSRRILESALRMVRATLDQHKISSPISWSPDHMLCAPAYANSFALVVERVIADGENARLLPLAMELRQFGSGGDARTQERLLARVIAAADLTSMLRAFVVQSLGIPSELLSGMAVPARGVSDVKGGASSGSTLFPQQLGKPSEDDKSR